MDLENLKNIWSEEKISETPEITLEKQKEIHLPLEKIRKNMRMEFWSTIGIIIPLVFVFAFGISDVKLKTYVLTLVAVAFLMAMFFFSKFFKLYKEISDLQLNSKDSLKDLLFQFELNKQSYLAYYVSFAPIIVCEMILFSVFLPGWKTLEGTGFLLFFVITTVLGLFVLYIFGKWWFSFYYGKYIKQIQEIVNDLK